MQIGALKKIATQTAEEISKLAQLGGQTFAPAPGASPGDFLQQLVTANQMNEAVHFMAYALPKREAVWWACMCARAGAAGQPLAPPVQAALEAAEAWVYKPTDENRRQAMAKAQATKFDTPGVWAAVAAFWSGPSMAPPDLPAVPPAAHLTGAAVAGAVTLAAVQTEPQMADEKRRRYIDIAIDIANGGSGRLEAKKPE